MGHGEPVEPLIECPMALHVEIITPTQTLFAADATEVTAPTQSGEVGILAQHTDYVGLLDQGTLSIKSGATTKTFEVSGGVIKVANDKVLVLVDKAG